jgi:Ice-binding-like
MPRPAFELTLMEGLRMMVTRGRRRACTSIAGCALVLAAAVALFAVGGAQAAISAVPLGSAQSFSVLAGAGITNTGPTRVSGDIGTFPTTSINGTGSLTVGGTNHGGDAVTQKAKTDLVTAYTTAAGEGPTNPIAADLTGRTLVPGVYNSASSIGLSGALTLNGQGNPNAIFVFQAGSTLTTGSGSRIVLINGAQACNVYWKVGSSATLGTGSSFLGTIIALTSITVTTGVTIDGRTLARNGAVTLDTDTITTPTCTTTPPTTTTTTTTATGTTATPGSTRTKAEKAQQALAAKRLAERILAQKAAAKKLAAANARTIALAPPKVALHRYALTG